MYDLVPIGKPKGRIWLIPSHLTINRGGDRIVVER